MPDRILQFLFHFFPDICAMPAILSWYLSNTGSYFSFLCAKSFHFPGICVVLIVIFGE